MKTKTLLFICMLFTMHTLSGQSPVEALQHRFDSLFAMPSKIHEAIESGKLLIARDAHAGIPDSTLYGRNLLRTGLCYYKLAIGDSVDFYAKKAYNICKPNSDDQLYALKMLGDMQVGRSNFIVGDSLLEEALRRRRTFLGTNSLSYFKTLYGLANSKYAQDQYVAADKIFSAGIELWEKQNMGQIPFLAILYAGSAEVKRLLGEQRQAEKLIRTGIAIRSNQPPGSAPAVNEYSTLIQLLIDQGRFEEALEAIHKISADLEDIGLKDSHFFINLLQKTGIIQIDLGLYNEAIQNLQASMRLSESTKVGTNEPTYYQTAILIAHATLNKGEPQKALQILEPYRDSILVLQWENTLTNLLLLDVTAKCAEQLGKRTDAIAEYRKMLEICEHIFPGNQNDTYIETMTGLAEMLLQDGRAQEAVQTLRPLTEIKDKLWLGTNDRWRLRVMAQSEAMAGNRNAAFKNFEQLMAEEKKSYIDELFILTDKQRFIRAQNIHTSNDALLTFTAANPSLEAATLALNFQLFNKSLLLSAAQNTRNSIQNDPALATVFTAWTDTRERLAWSYTQPKANLEIQKISISALEVRADSLENQIAHSSSAFASASLRKPFYWTDVQNKLQTGEAVIEITRFSEYKTKHVDTSHYAVFIITPHRNHPDVIFIPEGDQIEQNLTEQYLSECAAPEGQGRTDALYKGFWQKLEPYLKGVSRLYVSADGAFLKINLGAIRLPSGSYVADQMDVRSVFSLKDVGAQEEAGNKSKEGPKTAFLVGNPAFLLKTAGDNSVATLRGVSETPDSTVLPGSTAGLVRDLNDTRGITLADLPGSAQEVRDIAELLNKKGWQSTVITGLDAKEESLKSIKSPTVLHLATHGYFLANVRSGTAGISRSTLESNPMLRSMLFFAGAQNTLDKKPLGREDGILTAYEAQNLQLEGTELVVLSACKTAQGKIQNGEGVYGLQRALRIAGAQAVLMSLWDVDDKVGREFMTLFYEKWLGGLPKSEAFRAAQLAVKKQHPQPFYWAGFLLME